MVLCDFLGRARALKAIYDWNISPKQALVINRNMLISHFGHLASLVWTKLILDRFRDAVLPDFSRYPAGSDDYLNAFSLIPVMEDIAVDMSQGYRIYVRVFCFLYN